MHIIGVNDRLQTKLAYSLTPPYFMPLVCRFYTWTYVHMAGSQVRVADLHKPQFCLCHLSGRMSPTGTCEVNPASTHRSDITLSRNHKNTGIQAFIKNSHFN